MSADFANKSVLIIGASRAGIGSAIAHAFKSAGAAVTITGVEPAPAEQDQGQFTYHQLDVTDQAAITDLAGQFPTLDILINCAAITARGEEMEPDFFARVVDINLHGTFRTARAFHPALAKTNGNVINIASMYAQFGSPQNPAYGASKAAVQQLTKSLSIAWAPDGIRVNAISPGFIETAQSARSRENPTHVANVTARTPLARWGQPADIAGAALFLASPAASFITGACIPVDGGYSVA
jgi:NAD(P)-dependent dehydrogenase (short-subunit alcohol dehydrogenase family)